MDEEEEVFVITYEGDESVVKPGMTEFPSEPEEL
jgi:hypothetical protein